jgi:hypothetical protein
MIGRSQCKKAISSYIATAIRAAVLFRKEVGYKKSAKRLITATDVPLTLLKGIIFFIVFSLSGYLISAKHVGVCCPSKAHIHRLIIGRAERFCRFLGQKKCSLRSAICISLSKGSGQ